MHRNANQGFRTLAKSSYCLSIARQLPKFVSLWALAAHLSTDPNAIWEEALVRQSENARLAALATRFWLMGERDDEDDLENAIRCLEQIVKPGF